MLTLSDMWVLLNPFCACREVELKKFKSHRKIRCLNQSVSPHVLSMKAYIADLSIKVTSSTTTQWPQGTTSRNIRTSSFYHLSVLSKMCFLLYLSLVKSSHPSVLCSSQSANGGLCP